MFLVMEIQKFQNGNFSTPVTAYPTREKAESKYYSILASAAVSTLPLHAAVLMTEEGYVLSSQSYKHVEEESSEDQA